MDKLLADANSIKDTQGQPGNWNHDPYMMGLYNGMEMIMSIMEKREPVFKEKPEIWLADKAKENESPVEQQAAN